MRNDGRPLMSINNDCPKRLHTYPNRVPSRVKVFSACSLEDTPTAIPERFGRPRRYSTASFNARYPPAMMLIAMTSLSGMCDRQVSQDSLDGFIWKSILFRGVMMITSSSESSESSKNLTNLARFRVNFGSISMRPKLVSAWRLHVTRHIFSFIKLSRILVGFVEALVTPYILSLYSRMYSTA